MTKLKTISKDIQQEKPGVIEEPAARNISQALPLSFIKGGSTVKIAAVKGNEETKRFLGSLGFVEGTDVTVVNESAGNMIINVKDARVAISNTMAMKIYTV